MFNELSGGINPETLKRREMNSGAMFNANFADLSKNKITQC